jgi:diguanylate cyclase
MIDPMLVYLADAVIGARTLEDLARPLLELMQQVTGFDTTFLTTVDESRGVQQVIYTHGSQRLPIPEQLQAAWGDTLCKRAYTDGQRFSSDVASRWGDSPVGRQLGIAAYLTEPVLTSDGALFGTLCAANAERKELPDNAETIMRLGAVLIGERVDRDRLLQHLQAANLQLASQSLVDDATGLPNRRALREELSRMLVWAARCQVTLQIALVDLENCKDVRVAHGQRVGERLLRTIGSQLQRAVQPGDLVARHDGDALVVVSAAPPGCDAEADAALAQRLAERTSARLDADGLPVEFPGTPVGVVHVAPLSLEGRDWLAEADAALHAVDRAQRVVAAETDTIP